MRVGTIIKKYGSPLLISGLSAIGAVNIINTADSFIKAKKKQNELESLTRWGEENTDYALKK